VPAQNPDIPAGDLQPPVGKYTITFIDERQRKHVIEVDPAKIPFGHRGQPGSLLDVALGHGVEIDHACGGVCACSTCHVIVKDGLDSCNEPSDAEEDQLDNAYGVRAQSRLACQCVPRGTKDLLVIVPGWNRNLVRERD
jgi:2Fe-2S ferredoxin